MYQYRYSALAKATMDPTVCERITDTRSQGSCYFTLAQQLDDSSLCDRSPEEHDRKMCHSRYNQYRLPFF
ncbi:MAG: hypothetical protein HYV33_02560 [Candidatus Kerfeldbacteria bacterium]|nr:hypothetical protein [Candidatus Kerfeldbacteria bacterium]